MSDNDRYQVSGSLGALERAEMVLQVERASRALELADPDAHVGRVDRAINRGVEFIGVCTLGVIATIVFSNATLRYAMNSAIIWGEEFVISLIPLLAFIGLFLSVRRGRVIRIETFTEMMSPGLRCVVDVGANLLATAAFLYLGYNAVTYIRLFGLDPMVYFDLPKGMFQSALLIGAFLVAFAFFSNAVRAARRAAGTNTL